MTDWNLFIDDERNPLNVTWVDTFGDIYQNWDWVIARSFDEAIELIKTLGVPRVISFDHDLGPADTCPTGFDIAKKIIEMDMDGELEITPLFFFYIHSQNPIGKQNIEGLLDQYLNFKMRVR